MNRRVGDWKAVAASVLFRSLVYPAAMRQVLWHIYKVEETRALDDADDWRSRWLAFAQRCLVSAPLLSPATTTAIGANGIDDAVESFTRQHFMLDHYTAFLGAEASE